MAVLRLLPSGDIIAIKCPPALVKPPIYTEPCPLLIIGAESICVFFRVMLLLDTSISNIIPYLTGAPKETAN